MNKIFEEMTDEDFFSDKLKHIYFTKDVNNESVQELHQLKRKMRLDYYKKI